MDLLLRVVILVVGLWLFFRVLRGHSHLYFSGPMAYVSAAMLLLFISMALFAPEISPQNPYDLAQLNIMDSRLAPGSSSIDQALVYHLGTDDQGRDILSGILYGLRVSLTVSASSARARPRPPPRPRPCARAGSDRRTPPPSHPW